MKVIVGWIQALGPEPVQILKLAVGFGALVGGVVTVATVWRDLGIALLLSSGFLLFSVYLAYAPTIAGHPAKIPGSTPNTSDVTELMENEKANLGAAILASAGIVLGLVTFKEGVGPLVKVGAVSLAVTVILVLLHQQALGGVRITRQLFGRSPDVSRILEAALLNGSQGSFAFGLISVALGLL